LAQDNPKAGITELQFDDEKSAVTWFMMRKGTKWCSESFLRCVATLKRRTLLSATPIDCLPSGALNNEAMLSTATKAIAGSFADDREFLKQEILELVLIPYGHGENSSSIS
jgi:hypothetical protein